MLRNYFGCAVDLLKYLFLLLVPKTNAKQKLPCRRHLNLNIVQKCRILFQQLSHIWISLRFQAVLDMHLVPVKTFTTVKTNDFQFRDHAEQHHQMIDFHINILSRQHRNIGGLHTEKSKFSLVRLQTVFTECPQSKQVLR